MADEASTTSSSLEPQDIQSSTEGTANHDHDLAAAPPDSPQQATENTFQINIRLPHAPYHTQTIVSTQDQAQDVRQSIIDTPHTFQYSCFHLDCKGKRIPDFVDLADIPEIAPDVELTLVEDPYTEKDARVHFLRIQGLIGAAGDRTDLVQGIEAGVTLHDELLRSHGVSSATPNEHGQVPHAMAGYDIASAGSLDALLIRSNATRPKTVKSLSLSPWNPPPYHLRTKGHLLYLQVTTNEGEQHQITSHASGFYVNKSSNSKFDPFPRPAPKAYRAHSLFSLISELSPSFDSAFGALQEQNASRDPLSTFQPSNAIPASPWIVPQETSALSSHAPDISRTQESYLLSGADNAETLRDWNEEIQTTRELPRATVQDRVFRERVTSRLFADYNEAATAGAVLIARGEVAPMNPTENKDAQIFVYNNIFYSFGADGVGTFANEGGDEAARVATGKDVVGVRTVNQLDIQGLSAPGTVVIDYLGKRLVGQSIVPGIFKQREPGEQQVDYGGVEGKDVVASNPDFVPLFSRLSTAARLKKHPVWDKERKRHDLEASVETKGLLGTDGRKYALDLYRITPLDVSWIEQHWVEPSTDGEPPAKSNGYVHRMTVLRPELIEAFWRFKLREYIKEQAAKAPVQPKDMKASAESEDVANGSPNGKSAELTNGHSNGATEIENPQGDEAQQGTAAETSQAPVQDHVDISGFQFALNPDVFSGQQPLSEEEKEEWAKDEADVRAACAFLHSDVIPRLIQDLQDGEVGFPMDGESLSALLHRRGINVRYLGKVAELASTDKSRLKALRALAVQEMVARAFKHATNRYLRHLPSPFASSCVAHLLNCLLGAELNKSPRPVVDKDLKTLYPEDNFVFETANPRSFADEIAYQVRLRYRYELGSDWKSNIKHIQLLREIALKMGLQLGAKTFVFSAPPDVEPPGDTAASGGETAATMTNGQARPGGKKKKKGTEKSPNREIQSPQPNPQQTFSPEDILNIVPVVKESSPKSVLAEEALEAGRISVVQNQRELGQELLLESLTLHEQIYGVIHPEVARVYYQLSTLFYGLDDKPIAVELARKAVIVSERALGVDAHETLLAYLNLGLFEHAVGNTHLALAYVRHALDLWKIVYGSRHPDSITTMNNAAVMLQNLKIYHDSRLWFEASLAICQEISGPGSVNTATLLFQLAQALALDQDPKGAVHRMREAYNIFNAELGADDRNTKEAETWLEQLTQNAVTIAKHAKDLQARRLQKIKHISPRVTLGTRVTPQVGQTVLADLSADAAAVASGAAVGTAAPSRVRNDNGLGGIDERSIDELLKYINGVDAAKAKATPKKTTANPKARQQRVH